MAQARIHRLIVGASLSALAAVVLPLGAGHAPRNAAAAPPAQADLVLTKTDQPDPVKSGAVLTYTLLVHNAGPDPAPGTVLTDSLPSGVSFISATPSSASCNPAGSKVVCRLPGSVSTTADRVVTIKVRVTRKRGPVSNTASVSSQVLDPHPGNNLDTEATKIAKPPKPVICAGRPVTIAGTAGPDTLVGTPGYDVIRSFSGDDRVFGLAGGDVICAGAGSDLVKAGKGNDFVRGGSGSDRIRGRRGDDALYGRHGRDRLRGGNGDDLLAGGPGFDRCRGGRGLDTRRSCERR